MRSTDPVFKEGMGDFRNGVAFNDNPRAKAAIVYQDEVLRWSRGWKEAQQNERVKKIVDEHDSLKGNK